MRRLRAMGIRDKPIAPASPWQNGFAERLIGSIRRECVDHVIVAGERHLRRILRTYAVYYNDIRTHRSLDKDAPAFRPVQRIGNIEFAQILADCITIGPGLGFRHTQVMSDNFNAINQARIRAALERHRMPHICPLAAIRCCRRGSCPTGRTSTTFSVSRRVTWTGFPRGADPTETPRTSAKQVRTCYQPQGSKDARPRRTAFVIDDRRRSDRIAMQFAAAHRVRLWYKADIAPASQNVR